MGPSNSSCLSNIAIFHFHDYGRKSTQYQPKLEVTATLLSDLASNFPTEPQNFLP